MGKRNFHQLCPSLSAASEVKVPCVEKDIPKTDDKSKSAKKLNTAEKAVDKACKDINKLKKLNKLDDDYKKIIEKARKAYVDALLEIVAVEAQLKALKEVCDDEKSQIIIAVRLGNSLKKLKERLEKLKKQLDDNSDADVDDDLRKKFEDRKKELEKEQEEKEKEEEEEEEEDR